MIVIAVVMLSTLVAWSARPAPAGLLFPATAAYARGLEYLRASQRDNGEFPTYYWFTDDPAKTEYVTTVFTAAQVLYSLGSAAMPSSVADAVARRTVAYLLTEREPPGVWRYYGKAGGQILSPDVDDTSVAWAALQTQGLDVDPAALDALWASRSPTGLFNTWIGDPATWVGVDSRDVDLVVNLNALLLFSLVGEPVDAVCRRAVESVRTGAFVQGTIYYASPLAFTYALSRAHADGGAGCLGDGIQSALEMVLRAQQENGTWESDLDTALALLTLLNGRYRGEALQRGFRALIARQAPDGGWDLGRAYRGAVIPVNYGSRSLTTGLCLEALGKYLRGLRAAVSEARMTRDC